MHADPAHAPRPRVLPRRSFFFFSEGRTIDGFLRFFAPDVRDARLPKKCGHVAWADLVHELPLPDDRREDAFKRNCGLLSAHLHDANRHGDTVLHYAAWRGCDRACRVLLGFKALRDAVALRNARGFATGDGLSRPDRGRRRSDASLCSRSPRRDTVFFFSSDASIFNVKGRGPSRFTPTALAIVGGHAAAANTLYPWTRAARVAREDEALEVGAAAAKNRDRHVAMRRESQRDEGKEKLVVDGARTASKRASAAKAKLGALRAAGPTR